MGLRAALLAVLSGLTALVASGPAWLIPTCLAAASLGMALRALLDPPSGHHDGGDTQAA